MTITEKTWTQTQVRNGKSIIKLNIDITGLDHEEMQQLQHDIKNSSKNSLITLYKNKIHISVTTNSGSERNKVKHIVTQYIDKATSFKKMFFTSFFNLLK